MVTIESTPEFVSGVYEAMESKLHVVSPKLGKANDPGGQGSPVPPG